MTAAAEELIPARPSLRALRRAAAGCRACPLWRSGTQTVFGAGPTSARVMLVGEQPGDREDRAGEPFVGPAGEVLERGSSLYAIARLASTGGRSGRLVNVTPNVIARYARLLDARGLLSDRETSRNP